MSSKTKNNDDAYYNRKFYFDMINHSKDNRIQSHMHNYHQKVLGELKLFNLIK